LPDSSSEGKRKDKRKASKPGEEFEKLVSIMEVLRSKEGGCPWDLEQTQKSLSRYLLEETYEAVEAIEEEDWEHLKEELGDLLLQIVFQSRIAEEEGKFEISQVITSINEKLIRRHPHIFGSGEAKTAEEVSISWDRIKREEEGDLPTGKSPRALPALLVAMKIQGKAKRAGFDWASFDGVIDKMEEEIEELKGALGCSREKIEKEVGDLLFSVVNLARHLEVDPEIALRIACKDFEERYTAMELEAERRGKDFASMSIDEKEEIWQEVKGKLKREKQRGKDERDIGYIRKGDT